MDEGINSYTEVKVMDSIFGKDTSFLNIAGITTGERELQRLQYLGGAPIAIPWHRMPTPITTRTPTAA